MWSNEYIKLSLHIEGSMVFTYFCNMRPPSIELGDSYLNTWIRSSRFTPHEDFRGLVSGRTSLLSILSASSSDISARYKKRGCEKIYLNVFYILLQKCNRTKFLSGMAEFYG